MAKQKKVPPAKTPDARDDESLLLRSAESLGRVIGALQRQLDGATRRLAETADVFDQERTTPARSSRSRKTRSARSAPAAAKTRSTAKAQSKAQSRARKGAKKRAAAAGATKRASTRKSRR